MEAITLERITVDETVIQEHIEQFTKIFTQLDVQTRQVLYDYIGSCPRGIEWALAMEYVVSLWGAGELNELPVAGHRSVVQ